MTRFCLFIVFFVVMVFATPPTGKKCFDVKNITYDAATLECSMEIKAKKHGSFTLISGNTLETLSAQSTCDFFPFIVSTKLCSELIEIMCNDGV